MKNNENASRAAVAVKEWVNGFELVMGDPDANKRVEVARRIVTKLFEVRHFTADQIFTLGRRVDDVFRLGILKFCSGQIANAGFVLLDDVNEVDGEVGRKKGPFPDDVYPVPERIAIMQDFFSVRRNVGGITVSGETTKQLIVRSEDVLDLGAQFCFLKS